MLNTNILKKLTFQLEIYMLDNIGKILFVFILHIANFLTLFTRVAIKLQYSSQPYFKFSNLRAIASFIDLSRIVTSTRRAGRSANECSDRKNSEIYSLMYNDILLTGALFHAHLILRVLFAHDDPVALQLNTACIGYYFNKQKLIYVLNRITRI